MKLKLITLLVGISLLYSVEVKGMYKIEDTNHSSFMYPIIETDILEFTEEEIELIALVTVGEAEGESELGKRLVADTIINRVHSDIYPNTVNEVCYQPNQYSCLHNGRCKKCKVDDDIRELVKEEVISITNSEVLYFSTGGYQSTPIIKEGAHYFSGK